ncbi:MAG TPA: hypothetical protein VL117_06865 [Thermoleophilia bacterium]|nr:hypothetical protein [Thermoleophilia bacterium]
MNERYLHRLSRPFRDAAPAAAPTPSAPELVVVMRDEATHAEAARARRRRVTSCEVCGRTLLTGEQPREIVVLERSVWACPLCVIESQATLRRQAA